MKIVSLLFVISMVTISTISLAQKKPSDFDVVTACKKHCPDAKTNAEAHECAERKGKIRKSFKKTNCWDVNEQYEKVIEESNKAKR